MIKHKYKICKTCKGSGAISSHIGYGDYDTKVCQSCTGDGKVLVIVASIEIDTITSKDMRDMINGILNAALNECAKTISKPSSTHASEIMKSFPTRSYDEHKH